MRILHADDHKMIRDTIQSFLTEDGQHEVEGCGSFEEVVSALAERDLYDIILLDLQMPGMQGLYSVSAIVEKAGETPVVVLTGTGEGSTARKLIQAGARGFFHKGMSAKCLESALQLVVSGQVFLPYELDDAEQVETGDLNAREVEVLEGLCRGMTNKEIAMEIGLKEVTIKFYVQSLSRKLDARNRTQAALIGRELLSH